MRAARLHRPREGDQPADLRIDEVPTPEPGPGQVLVRVRACGVCASDLHVVEGVTPHGPHLPQTLGHEPAGEVAAVGEGVDEWMAGDRVAIAMARPCERCEYCLQGRQNLCVTLQVPGVDVDGAQAEYFVADAHLLVPIPDGLDFAQAAIMTDALATPYHALKRGGVADGVTVAIFGLGGLGMHALQLAMLAGSEVIGVDVDEVNLQRALDWGAEEVVDASRQSPARRIRELTDGGVERSFEFVGAADTVDQAVKSLRRGGRATIVGLGGEALQTLPLSLFVSQELEVAGSFGYTPQDLGELFDLAEAGRLDLSRSITHRYPLDELPRALDALASRDEHPVRIVITHD